ncbi:MAG: Lipopolysaccharide export system protein LptA precursor [Pseudomonadota bacterium]|jgi:lipopolysaccharide export system protein LptA
MKYFQLPLCALLWIFHWAPAWAEKADRDKPMLIEADRMQHDEAKKLTQFFGNVQALKGTMALRADRMDVQQDAQGKQKAWLWAKSGERVFFRQKREGVDEYTEGEAETAEYEGASDAVTLQTRAEMRILRGSQMADQLQGHKIVFNNATEVMTVDGQRKDKSSDSRSQRVRAVLAPKAAASQPAAPQLRTSPALKDGKP